MSQSGKSPESSHEEPIAPPRSAVILLLKDMASTTWRMFAPTLTMAILGAWADKVFGTQPLLAFIGVLVGAGIAGLLIKRQLTKVITEK